MNLNFINKSIAFALPFILSGWLFPGAAFSASSNRIELTDGTVIVGKIISLSNGVYKVKTGSLGIISISESSVESIRKEGGARPRTERNNASSRQSARSQRQSSDFQSQRRNIQNRLMNDPGAMERIQSLQNDSSMQKILNDPKLMKAINQGDLETLSRNPDIRALMNNPTVRGIIEQNQ